MRGEQSLPVLGPGRVLFITRRSTGLWVLTFRLHWHYVELFFVELEIGLAELNSALYSPLYQLAPRPWELLPQCP